MNWDALGAMGELISAVAVVATLIYVAVQLRQNTAALQSSTWQSIQDAEQRFDQFLASDPALIELFLRGGADGKAALADPATAMRYELMAKQLIDLFQTHHYQYEIGMIDDDWWQTWVLAYEDAITTWPGFREVVEERRRLFRPSFRRFVEERFRLADA